MSLSALWVLNRNGTLIYERDLRRSRNSRKENMSSNDKIRLASVFHGISAVAAKISPLANSAESSNNPDNIMTRIKTSFYTQFRTIFSVHFVFATLYTAFEPNHKRTKELWIASEGDQISTNESFTTHVTHIRRAVPRREMLWRGQTSSTPNHSERQL